MKTTSNKKKKTSSMLGIINTLRWKRIIIVSDNHGDMICPDAKKKLFEYIESFSPNLRVHLGDFMNLDALRVGASNDERMCSMRDDIAEGIKFLEEFKPDVLTEGNHDWRLTKNLMAKDPILREWCEDRMKEIHASTKKIGTNVYGWGVKRGVYEIAGQKMLHGYANGAMSATRTTGAKFGACVHGHNHSGDIVWLDTYDHHGRFAQSCPSLCDNDKMSYQLGQTSSFKHITGWAMGIADTEKNIYYPGFAVKAKDGSFVVMEPKPL